MGGSVSGYGEAVLGGCAKNGRYGTVDAPERADVRSSARFPHGHGSGDVSGRSPWPVPSKRHAAARAAAGCARKATGPPA